MRLVAKRYSKGWFWHPVDPSTGNAAPERFGPYEGKREAISAGLVHFRGAQNGETESTEARTLLRYEATDMIDTVGRPT